MCPQQPAAGLYPEPVEYNPHMHTLFPYEALKYYHLIASTSGSSMCGLQTFRLKQ
jgi:hypothetical protein